MGKGNFINIGLLGKGCQDQRNETGESYFQKIR